MSDVISGPEILNYIKSYVLGWMRDYQFQQVNIPGGSAYAPTPHAIYGAHHNGLVDDAQATQFLKVDGSRGLTGNLAVSSGVTIDGVDISTLPTSQPIGANPSASVGLTAVNGSASTFMRSDAAPPILISISPTWSGKHIFPSGANGAQLGDFTNSNHTHLSAAQGGTLDAAAVTSGLLALARGGTNANLSATGGAGFYLKQSSVGAAISVAAILDADLPGTITRTSRNLIAGAGLTGGGDLSADRTFNVGAGLGITVNADDVALTTPGTLTVSSTNSSTGSHTHAITSSSNPGGAAALLASDASGQLTLVNLLANGTTFSLINTVATTVNFAGAATSLSIGATTGTLNLNNAAVSLFGTLLKPNTGYATDIGSIGLKFKSVFAAELWVETLVAQDTLATIGGRILVGPTTTLIADLVATRILDTFTDTDDTALTAHTIAPVNVPATSWTAGTGTFKILSNKMTPSTSGEGNYTTLDSGISDYTMSADIVARYTSSSVVDSLGLICRFSDSDNYWLMEYRPDSSLLNLYEKNAGSFTLRASGAITVADNVSANVMAIVQGTSIQAYLNGALICSYTSTFNQTATKVGLRESNAGSPGPPTCDNFSVGTQAIDVKHNNLTSGDRVLLQANGSMEWLAITSSYTAITGGYRYSVTRDLDGTGMNNWSAGDAVFNTGSTGNGFWDLFSLNSTISIAPDFVYNHNAAGNGTPWEAGSYSTNYNQSSSWTPFADNSSTEIGDSIYFGIQNTTWNNLYFNLTTAAAYTATLVWEFWNGTAWTSFTPTFVGNVSGDFKATGWQGFEWTASALTAWAAKAINSQTAYWVRVRVSAFTSWTTQPVQSARRVYYNKGRIGPSIVLNKRNSSTWNDITEHMVMGELVGYYGYGASTIGVGIGEYAAAKAHITIDSVNGYRTFSGLTTVVQQIDVSGNIYIGRQGVAGQDYIRISSGALDLINNATIRIHLAADGSGYLANSSISWDTSGNLTVAANATIGGWTVSAAKIAATGIDIISGSGAALAFGATPPTSASAGTGLWLDRFGMVGEVGGVTQAKFDAVTGAIIAGAGDVSLDTNGVRIGGTNKRLSFYDTNSFGALIGQIYAFSAAEGFVIYLSAKGKAASISGSMITAAVNSDTTAATDLKIEAFNSETYSRAYLSPSVGSLAGFVIGAVAVPNAMLDVRGDIAVSNTTNGQQLGIKTLTELTTIAAAAYTDTTFQVPAGAVVIAASTRVTVAIPTATTYSVKIAPAGALMDTGLSVAVNTTGQGSAVPMIYTAAAASIRITPSATPANTNGRVRVTAYYFIVTPPTS